MLILGVSLFFEIQKEKVSQNSRMSKWAKSQQDRYPDLNQKRLSQLKEFATEYDHEHLQLLAEKDLEGTLNYINDFFACHSGRIVCKENGDWDILNSQNVRTLMKNVHPIETEQNVFDCWMEWKHRRTFY